MNTQDTPETDALRQQFEHHLPNWLADQFVALSRRLERERDEARRKLQSERDLPTHLLDVDAICQQRDEARRERDEAIAALQTIASLDFVITLPDRMDAVRDIANQALNNIKQHQK